MRNIPYLRQFLDADEIITQWGNVSKHEAVAGWGLKPSSLKARTFAKKNDFPYLAVEDGFLRSVGLGGDDAPLSLIVDDVGVYYDARSSSRLELLIPEALSDDQLARSQQLISSWREHKVSKYNHQRELVTSLPAAYVLVVEQTLGDASIQYGLADSSTFQKMLTAALDENPDCEIVLKVHPEVLAGRKKGHFDLERLSDNPRVILLGEDVHPASLLEHAQAVYCVTSQMGFEALLWSKPVRTFGMPFYAGWGLTDDELTSPLRRKTVLLEQLVHAALISYPHYIDPETGVRCEVESVLNWLGLQRRMRQRFEPELYAYRFSLWKRPIVHRFFNGSTIRFVRNLNAVPKQAQLIFWGRRAIEGLSEYQNVLNLEDGFIRSVGLGADLVQPLSWVIDCQGLYYDATCPSELETILVKTEFSATLLARAEELRKRLVDLGITKYNTGLNEHWHRPKNKHVILVPGQVESDASLAFGSPVIRRNIDLLMAVRESSPHAYIIYKPHPDVVAGLRTEGKEEDTATEFCDEVISDLSMAELLNQVDEVHVLTSLTGFEALLRNKKVVCYGQPFYAGWGLTVDQYAIDRRGRRLSLNELVAGTLIYYPTYISRTTNKFTTPERALDEVLEWKNKIGNKVPWYRAVLRLLLKVNK